MSDDKASLRRLWATCRSLSEEISELEARQLVARASLSLALVAEQHERRRNGLHVHVIHAAELLFRAAPEGDDSPTSRKARETAHALMRVAVAMGGDPRPKSGRGRHSAA